MPLPLPPHLSALRTPARLPDIADAVADDVTWAYAWPAGQKLSAELASIADCAGKRVADLGCGRGHCGLSALMAGAAFTLFADASERALSWLDQVICLNGLSQRAGIQVHIWGQPLHYAPYELIVGGDILYRPELFPELLATIAASLAPGGACYLSDPRERIEDELPDIAADQGLSLRQQRRDGGWTLICLKQA